MPRGDRTGPNGNGPMTGRRMGYCNGYQEAGFVDNGFRRGCRGRSFGRINRGNFRKFSGYGRADRRYYPSPRFSKEDEKKMINNEINVLKQELESLENRLTDLSSEE